MLRRFAAAACLVACLAGFVRAGDPPAGIPLDPLTGATPDPGAGMGAPAREIVYFDARGRMVPDRTRAATFAITDHVLGISTVPRPMEEMSASERKEFGLPAPFRPTEPTRVLKASRSPSSRAATAAAPGNGALGALQRLGRLYDGAAARP